MRKKMCHAAKYAAVVFLLLVSLAGAQQPDEQMPGASDNASRAQDAPQADEAPRSLVDPFAYNVPGDAKGFLPSLTGNVPAGIRVAGILLLRNRQPLAALLVPGYDEPFYVHENDLIAITTRTAFSGAPPDKRGAPARAAKDETMYIQIGAITESQVEVFPKTNPSNIQILR